MMKKTFKYLDKNLEFIFLCLFGIICLLSVLLQVIARVVKFSLPWTEEVCRYSFIWVTFWGMSYAIKQKNNIRFELLLKAFKGKGVNIVEIIIDIIMLFLFAVLFYLSIQFMIESAGRLAPALNISKSVVNICAPICVGVCIFREIQQLIEHFKELRREGV